MYRDNLSSRNPTLNPQASDSLIKIARGSKARANKEREKGHPFCILLWKGNASDIQPLVWTHSMGAL